MLRCSKVSPNIQLCYSSALKYAQLCRNHWRWNRCTSLDVVRVGLGFPPSTAALLNTVEGGRFCHESLAVVALAGRGRYEASLNAVLDAMLVKANFCWLVDFENLENRRALVSIGGRKTSAVEPGFRQLERDQQLLTQGVSSQKTSCPNISPALRLPHARRSIVRLLSVTSVPHELMLLGSKAHHRSDHYPPLHLPTTSESGSYSEPRVQLGSA